MSLQGRKLGLSDSGLSKALDTSFKQLSPRAQNLLCLEEEVLAPGQLSSFSQGPMQKVSKENMPISQHRMASEKLKSEPPVPKSIQAHTRPAKKRKLQPYVLIPTVSHRALSKKDRIPSSTSKASPPRVQNGPNVLAAALFQQFSHNSTAPDGDKPAQPAPSVAGPSSSSLRKRTFSTRESTPDELLMCVPAAESAAPTTKANSEARGNPDPEEAPGSVLPVDTLKIGDVDAIGLDADAQLAAANDDTSDSQSQVQPHAEEAWKGPPRHAFVPEPPVHRSSYYRRRERAILEKALADGAEREKAGVGRYNPPVGWQELCRVPGRRPNVTRTETRAQRYTAILEHAYGPGDVRRGHGRKPYKVKEALSALYISSEDESDDESVVNSERREDITSDTSLTDPPVTPPDEPLVSTNGGNAGVLNGSIIVHSEEELRRQHPFAERESVLLPEPASAPTPFGTVDPRKLTLSAPATEPKPASADLVAVATPELDSSLQIALEAPSAPATIPERSNDANSHPKDPLDAGRPPVHHIRWHNPEEWKTALRRLVSGKKQAAIEDLVNVNKTILSLEEMIGALPGEMIVRILVRNVAEYLMQLKDLPDDYIPFGDQFDLRKRSANVLRAAYGFDTTGPLATL